MPEVQSALKYEICQDCGSCAVPVIVVAAGSSQRMNGIDKQLVPLKAVPVIVRTLKAFENSSFISKIIVVTRSESILSIEQLCEKYMISKLSSVVSGGQDRHESVLKGLERLDVADSKVLVHDGARPLVTSEMIKNCVLALEGSDCAICAVKINDTVKKAEESGFITATVDRQGLYYAQTPQGFDVALYKKASAAAQNRNIFTDDASVMESAGHKVKIIEGSPYNIKITTPQDIKLAEIFLEG